MSSSTVPVRKCPRQCSSSTCRRRDRGSGGGGGRCRSIGTGVDAGEGCGVTRNRRSAQDDCRWSRAGRNNRPTAPPASAASCSRRPSTACRRFRLPITTATAGQRSACSQVQSASRRRIGRTTIVVSRSSPSRRRASGYSARLPSMTTQTPDALHTCAAIWKARVPAPSAPSVNHSTSVPVHNLACGSK